MELAALVAESLLAGAKSTEVFCGLRNYIVVELEVDAACLCCCGITSAVVHLSLSDGRSIEPWQVMRWGKYVRGGTVPPDLFASARALSRAASVYSTSK